MPVRPIVITGEPVLHRRAEPVTDFGPDLQSLIDDMLTTQEASNGVGLAAPQIGVGLRVFTWSMANEDGVPEIGVIVNPFVRPAKPAVGEPDKDNESEGCLSVPGLHYPLRRGESAEVTGVDRFGEDIAFTATGWFARCMQHEYDHLNGFLYVDRLGEKWKKKALKAIRSEGWGRPGHSWMPGVDEDPFGH
ncbi:peptide deformylase [Nostocoides jenkinsii]|jgi:peptide deformylase|uniref:Peptide deformylase n=1 Tax=Nostocoides jenkinsii Ben 74 TaxID=1193518 RepID=A0A077MAT3_9MICO|nr:peptide deformylase [Tetrasphaera jenkinsii]CCI54446.1 Peptide deformylase 2 [Tetrasphaera jenkinsii Ben 74]